MNTDFWLARWSRNEIGFHQHRFNEYLLEFWPRLAVAPTSTAFVPLCGKTLDMRWLREQAGHRVLGIEVARSACQEFFAEWGVDPVVSSRGPFESFAASDVEILCGDFFAMTPADVADVGAVFDRAALIALPTELRVRYARKMRNILNGGTRILLIAPDYEQREMSGPPFAVGIEEVHALYAGCRIEMLAEVDVTEAPDNARFRQRGLNRLVERVFRIESRV